MTPSQAVGDQESEQLKEPKALWTLYNCTFKQSKQVCKQARVANNPCTIFPLPPD